MNDFKKLFGVRVEKIKKDKEISEHNKKLLLKYLQDKLSENVGYRRLLRLSEIIRDYAKGIKKDMDKVTEKDLREYISKLESSNYAEWTKLTYKIVIRNFYRKLNDNELPKFCKFMNMSTRKVSKKLPEDVWSEEEIDKLINATREPFWKAFISLGYESGARLGELLNMRIKDVKFTEFGAKIRLNGKTGIREIPIVKCIPYLSTYLKLHPQKDYPEAYLWVRSNGKLINDYGIRKQLRVIRDRAGIKKKCNPHLLFRHSRATQLANHLTESQLKQYFGWTQDSDMPAVYIHLSGRDIDNAVLGIYGLAKKKEEEIQNGLPIKCYRCGFPNEPNSKFCGNCGLPLDTKTAIEEERKIDKLSRIGNELLEKKDFQEILAEALKKLIEEKPELLQGLNFNTSQTTQKIR